MLTLRDFKGETSRERLECPYCDFKKKWQGDVVYQDNQCVIVQSNGTVLCVLHEHVRQDAVDLSRHAHLAWMLHNVMGKLGLPDYWIDFNPADCLVHYHLVATPRQGG